MALEKIVKVDKVEVVGDLVQVRQEVVVMEDGVQISRSYHRYVLTQGCDLDKEEKKVKDIALAVWE